MQELVNLIVARVEALRPQFEEASSKAQVGFDDVPVFDLSCIFQGVTLFLILVFKLKPHFRFLPVSHPSLVSGGYREADSL